MDIENQLLTIKVAFNHESFTNARPSHHSSNFLKLIEDGKILSNWDQNFSGWFNYSPTIKLFEDLATIDPVALITNLLSSCASHPKDFSGAFGELALDRASNVCPLLELGFDLMLKCHTSYPDSDGLYAEIRFLNLFDTEKQVDSLTNALNLNGFKVIKTLCKSHPSAVLEYALTFPEIRPILPKLACEIDFQDYCPVIHTLMQSFSFTDLKYLTSLLKEQQNHCL